MDCLWIFISFIIALGIPLKADAGCAQDLKNNQDFQSCFTGLDMYVSNEMQKMDQSDPNGIMNVFCSKTGREKVKCALSYIETCPDVMTAGDLNYLQTIGQSLVQIKQIGGFDSLCRTLSGDVSGDPCLAVSQCVATLTQSSSSTPSNPQNGPTPFSDFQFIIGYICGPLKGMLDCFKDTGDQCSHLLGKFEAFMEMGRKKEGPGAVMPTFEKVKMFAMQECTQLPADFATNTCVRDSVNGDNFVTCFQNVAAEYPTENNQASCQQYRAGHQCVSMYVGKKCGNQYTKSLEKTTPLLMAGIPSNCKLQSSDASDSSDVSGSGVNIRMSAVALVLALLVALYMK